MALVVALSTCGGIAFGSCFVKVLSAFLVLQSPYWGSERERERERASCVSFNV